MSKKEMTLVYYYVPEDKDDPDCPNVFGVTAAKNSIRLAHIYQSFPLKGSYIFRFKYDNEGSPVWLDLPNIDSKLPLYKDRIIVKATRVSWNESKLHSQYRQSPSQKIEATVKEEKIDFFESNPSQPVKSPQIKPPQQNLDMFSSKPNQGNAGFNLLDEHHFESSAVGSGQKKDIDLMHGFDKHGDLI